LRGAAARGDVSCAGRAGGLGSVGHFGNGGWRGDGEEACGLAVSERKEALKVLWHGLAGCSKLLRSWWRCCRSKVMKLSAVVIVRERKNRIADSARAGRVFL
jgi:hypothetical protein